VSWALLLALAAGAYALKALGLVVLAGRDLPDPMVRCLGLLPAALLSALIVVQTFAVGRQLMLDARAAGVGAAALAAWKGAPFPVVVVLGALVTAVIRALT
jgi:branched-subunit amino acid transport protein